MPRIDHTRKKRKRKMTFSGVRTETKVDRVVVDKNGDSYLVRKNGSKYPTKRNFTSIPVTRPVARILKVMKAVGNYPNWDEFMWRMIESRVEARSLPKLLTDKARYNIKVRKQAREKAMSKHRYFPHEHHRKDKDRYAVKEGVIETVTKMEDFEELERRFKASKKKRLKGGD